MRDSVPSARYSGVCNVLRLWSISLIPTFRVYRLYGPLSCVSCVISILTVTFEYKAFYDNQTSLLYLEWITSYSQHFIVLDTYIHVIMYLMNSVSLTHCMYVNKKIASIVWLW